MATKSKKEYIFGGIKEYSLEEIEAEILKEKVYLDVFAGSDAQFKENISELGGTLPLLEKLSGYRYNYKTDSFPDKKFPMEPQLGLMGQEVASVFPEATKKDEDGYLYVNYSSLVPVLLNAVKELSTKLDKAEVEIEKLKLKK
jgi:hypothetical protein